MTLNRSGESRHLAWLLISGKTSHFSSLSMMVTVGFLCMFFVILRNLPFQFAESLGLDFLRAFSVSDDHRIFLL